MSTTPQDLATQSACYQCAGVSLTEGMVLALLAQIVAGGGNVPSSGDTRITEAGDTRITESGDTRITQ